MLSVVYTPQQASINTASPDVLPHLICAAVGALADPGFPAHVISIFEQSKYRWVEIDPAVEHFQQSALQRGA